jgi:8-oxo-dGTP pyrophosphatase MutT (NUDIX family)
VHYYLMEQVGGSFEAYDQEFEELRWVPMDEAVALLDFQSESALVQRAYDALTLT